MGSKYKLRGAYLILQLILAMILMGFFAVAGGLSGNNFLDAYRDDLIRQEGEALDHALMLYSQEHTTTYPTGELDEQGNPITKTYGIYPKVSDINRNSTFAKYGYIPFSLYKNIHSWPGTNCPVGTWHYQVSADRMAYSLQAQLTNGYIYTTPGSLYSIKELNGDTTVRSTVSSTKGDWGSEISGKRKN